MKKVNFLLLALLFAPIISWAGPLEMSAGIALWQQKLDGNISYGTPRDEIDVSRDLGIDDEKKMMAYVAFEHFIPLVPNVRLMHSQVDSGGAAIINRNITFGGKVYPINRSVVTDLNFNHTDLTLYYNLADTLFDFDAGLTVRFLDGSVSLLAKETAPGAGDQIYEKQDFSAPVPMLYGRLGYDIPTTGFFVEAEANLITYSGSRLMDFKLGGGYLTDFNVGIEAGYRRMNLVLDDIDDVDTDVNISGFYAGLTLRF